MEKMWNYINGIWGIKHNDERLFDEWRGGRRRPLGILAVKFRVTRKGGRDGKEKRTTASK
jgi:hypothetical protein